MPNPYATFRERLRASLVDGVIWTIWFIGVIFLPWPDAIPGEARFAIWVGPPLVAEPLFLNTRRATIGQSMRGLVVSARPGRTFPSLPTLYLRHLVKFGLGGTSLVFCLFAPRGEAIHDRLFGTVVIAENSTQPIEPIRPKRGSVRRLLVMLLWLSVTTLVNSVFLSVLAGVLFPEYLEASEGEFRWLDSALTILLAIGEGYVLYRGVNGRLLGLRGNAPSAA